MKNVKTQAYENFGGLFFTCFHPPKLKPSKALSWNKYKWDTTHLEFTWMTYPPHYHQEINFKTEVIITFITYISKGAYYKKKINV